MPVSIVEALASGFESIYYVDTDNGRYVQFTAQGSYDDLQMERSGTDFFGDAMRFISRVVCPEDRERVALSLRKDALLLQLIGGRTFSLTFRLAGEDKPACYSLRVISAGTREGHHIVIGVSNMTDLAP